MNTKRVIMLTTLALLVGFSFNAVARGPEAGSLNKNPRVQLRAPIKIPGPRDLIGDLRFPCRNKGEVHCDTKNKRYKICEEDGFWSRWIVLQGFESELADACSRDCTLGEIICPFRDNDYRVCQADGHWSEFRRLADNEESNQVRGYCQQQLDRRTCFPGQYRCFNDGGYNRCGESGNWSEAGNTSGEFSTFLNRCLFPSRR